MPAAEDRLSKDARSQLMHALGGLLSLAAAMGIGRIVYTPILPYMADGLNLPAYQAGLIASANFFGYLAGALAGAAKSLPGKPRHWFLGGLLASAATSIAMALTTDLTAFLLIRFLSGVASAFVLVFSTTLILARLIPPAVPISPRFILPVSAAASPFPRSSTQRWLHSRRTGVFSGSQADLQPSFFLRPQAGLCPRLLSSRTTGLRRCQSLAKPPR